MSCTGRSSGASAWRTNTLRNDCHPPVCKLSLILLHISRLATAVLVAIPSIALAQADTACGGWLNAKFWEGSPTVVEICASQHPTYTLVRNRKGRYRDTPPHAAVEFDAAEHIGALLGAGASIEARVYTDGGTFLQVAAGWVPSKNVLALLIPGVDIDVQNPTGFTSLHCAAGAARSENGQVLLSASGSSPQG